MARAIEQTGKSPIRPANASVFKKTPGERGYNTIVKSQKTVKKLMVGEQYSQQTLDTIKGCLSIIEKNLEKQDVLSYLVDSFGEEQTQQLLQEKTTMQQQLENQYRSIIRPKDQPKDQPKE